jgi:phosphotransferase system enzyme I (PtsI)
LTVGEILRGIGVGCGVAVGQVVRIEPDAPAIVPTPVPPERVEAEIARFEEAREAAKRELAELERRVEEALGPRYGSVLEVERLILDDPSLVQETVRRIRMGRTSASWALQEAIKLFARRLEEVGDPYFRDRAGDLLDVQRRLQRFLRAGRLAPADTPEGPLVVVAHALGPADTVALARSGIVGIATDGGGRTSHTAILARALGLPAVVGLHDVSERARAGDEIIVDSDRGVVELRPDPAGVAVARERQRERGAADLELERLRDVPARTRDGVEILVRANVELPEEVPAVRRFGAQGIGLYRSEFLFLAHDPELPTEEDHYRTYRQLVEGVAPEPAVIRTLDLGGEKYFHRLLDRADASPVLGLRALRLCLRRPDIFRPQVRGLLRAAVHGNLRVLLPFVTTAEEVRAVRAIFAEEGEDLRSQGAACRTDVPVGIMIEVPAAAIACDLLCREADFLSIGTNDLVQYALAVDRGDDAVADLYQPLHPAILRMIRSVVHTAGTRGVPVSLCGEMAADPKLTGLLIGLGLRELSVPPRAVGRIRDRIRRTSVSEAVKLAEELVSGASAEEIERRLETARSVEGA